MNSVCNANGLRLLVRRLGLGLWAMSQELGVMKLGLRLGLP